MFSSRTNHGALGRSAFTLVELLVVITIIGILIGMLVPAVNSAREAGRSVQCKSNLNNLGKACLAHEEAQQIFPTGGWGTMWVGDPDRGFGEQQPGGWLYNILPHTDMNNLHDQQFLVNGQSISGKTPPGQQPNNTSKQQAMQQMVGTPWPIVLCPTRHRTALSAFAGGATVANNCGGVSAPSSGQVARTDYAVNGGSAALDQYRTGPAVGADASSAGGTQAQTAYFGSRTTGNGAFTQCTGVCFERSTIRKDDIKDGLSCTLLAGEKYLAPGCYGMGAPGSGCDSQSLYVGMSSDVVRTTSQTPMQDRAGAAYLVQDVLGNSNVVAFGSAHPNAANFVLCDGHTVAINYSVDPGTFTALGTRAGGDTVDFSKL